MKNWMDEFVNNTDLSQNRPIKEVVYESLRKTLIESKIPIGERFIEKEYSDRLNISRTPVRESLKQLESEGLVKYIPRTGVVVNRITKEDVIEIYKIRSLTPNPSPKARGVVRLIDKRYIQTNALQEKKC